MYLKSCVVVFFFFFRGWCILLLFSPKGSLVGGIRAFIMGNLFHGWGTFGDSLFPLRDFFIFRSLRLDNHRTCFNIDTLIVA